MEVEIVKLTNKDLNDFWDLIRVFENVFEWENFSFPARTHLQKLIENPCFLVFVAKTDAKLIGGLTVQVLERYDSEKPSAYIYDLGVSPDFQRKAVGKLLIKTLSEYCEKKGFDEAFVQAETEDTQAVNFYRTTGFSRELNATHFTYKF